MKNLSLPLPLFLLAIAGCGVSQKDFLQEKSAVEQRLNQQEQQGQEMTRKFDADLTSFRSELATLAGKNEREMKEILARLETCEKASADGQRAATAAEETMKKVQDLHVATTEQLARFEKELQLLADKNAELQERLAISRSNIMEGLKRELEWFQKRTNMLEEELEGYAPKPTASPDAAPATPSPAPPK